MTEFQPIVPVFFDAKINSVTVESGHTLLPTTIINVSEPWSIRVNFETSGFFAPLLLGNFEVTAFYEGMGTAPEGSFLPVAVGAAPAGPKAALVAVGAAALPVGTYKLVVTVTHKVGAAPTGIAGYFEAGMVQIVAP